MQVYQRRRKTKRSINLVAGDKVEVRREDEGLKGSWNSGTIVEFADSLIRLRYDHLLIDDGDSVIDGSVDEFDTLKHYRGTVRPMPIDLNIGFGLELSYGLCVGVYFSDAWWEGVIFDYEDGCEERSVFFPDSNIQRKISSEKVRISQDWNEVSGCWSRRGKWLFLELIEEKKEILPVDVPVKQIWYCVKDKKEFGNTIVDWTCRSRFLWYGLVTEVIREMYPTVQNDSDVSELQNGVHLSSEKTNVEEHCGNAAPAHAETSDLENILNFSYKAVESDLVTKPVTTSSNSFSCEAPSSVADTTEQCKNIVYNKSHGNHSTDHTGNSDLENYLNISCKAVECDLATKSPTSSKSVSCEIPNSVGDTTNECKNVGDQNYNPTHGNHSTPIEHGTWLPAIGTEMLPSAENCPNALQTYLRTSQLIINSKKNNGNSTLANVRKHLSYMGWRVEFKQGKVDAKSTVVFRYIAPDGKTVYSPLQACQHYFELIRKLMNHTSNTHHHGVGVVTDKLLDRNEQGVEEGSYDSCGKPPAFDIRNSEVEEVCGDHSSGVVPAKFLDQNEQGVQEAIHDSSGNPPVFDIRNSEVENVCGDHSSGVVPAKLLDHNEQGVQETIYDSCGNPPAFDICNSEVENVCGDSSFCVQATDSVIPESESPTKNHGDDDGRDEDNESEPEYCPQAVLDWIKIGANRSQIDRMKGKRARKHLSAVGWRLWSAPKTRYRRISVSKNENARGYVFEKMDGKEKRFTSPRGKTYISLLAACNACVEEGPLYENTNSTCGANGGKKLTYTKKRSQRSKSKRWQEMQNPCETHLMRPPKRGRHILEPNLVQYTPKTVLSCLVDNNVILPGTKVCCMGVDGQFEKVEGLIYREGINCKCCNKIFSLTKFEAHASNGCRHSAANILLECGRSLLQCQKKIADAIKLKWFSVESQKSNKRNQPCGKNDGKCSMCHSGDELVLCGRCPSAFHLSCIGIDLNDSIEGHWFCPSCRCGICNQNDFDGDFQQFTENTALCCAQCEQEYHAGCIRQKSSAEIENFPKGNWFCSEKCEQILIGLRKLLGKPIIVGNDSLTWTLLKFSNDDDLDEATIENQCKLSVALSVMHECFEPIKEIHTKKDLIEDVIFNKRSDLNRLNFSGFYTVLLERDDEVISVGTVRIYGDKVAEIPLVGTRFQYRRRGMCHILIDVLEKKLAELGVERLVLPAVSQTLHAWTTTFGFSKMTSSERLKFLQYTFLDFPDTVMCHKILKAPVPFQPTGYYNQLGNEIELDDEISDLFTEVNRAELSFLEPIPEYMPFQAYGYDAI